MQASHPSSELSIKQRYIKLAVLVIVAGNIYPLIYLRQNFQESILETFGITSAQLLSNYAWLGFIYFVTYLPSGWLSDRVSPRVLLSTSLLMAGLLGVWFSTIPAPKYLTLIYIGWGITAGLTFWSALIKATTLLAKSDEQGRFFGILEGGRGLVEAVLGSIAITIFAYLTNEQGKDTPEAMVYVIWWYVAAMLVLAPISFFILDDHQVQTLSEGKSLSWRDRLGKSTRDLKEVGKKPEIWLCGFCILAGFQLFFATYSFSTYLEKHIGLTAVMAGVITTAKLWMRPIGAVAAGFAGDFLDREKVLGVLMLLASVAMFALTLVSASTSTFLLMFIVLTVGFLTYSVRGIFWSTLESCNISNNIKGLAIGLISLIGYSPEMYLPLLDSYLNENYPGKLSYTIYFNIIAFVGLLGAVAAWKLKQVVAKNQLNQ